jgi:hypothetical protein
VKNVTVTLDERTAAWARNHAARHGMSLSRFLGELLQTKMHEARDYERAMRQYLGKKPVKLKRPGAGYPSRDDLHERDRLR